MTVEKMSGQLYSIIQYFEENFSTIECNFIVHSLGACVLAKILPEISDITKKVIFIAPALNQKELLRFWFSRKHAPSGVNVQWENYHDYLDEEAFQKYILLPQREGKSHWIKNGYYVENVNMDYTSFIQSSSLHFFHIHGSSDFVVPLKSVKMLSNYPFIIDGGDHELEKPAYVEKWLPHALKFLVSPEDIFK